jgi:hypothetical protein
MMRAPVLIVLGSQEPLVESAMAARERRKPTSDLRQAHTPKEITIDASFPAVPLGSAKAAEIVLDSTNPKKSDTFALRGHIEVEHPTKIPEEVGGAAVYSDLTIEPFLSVCPESYA